jgi:hypothetical protein
MSGTPGLEGWLRFALDRAPLDRIHLMKALFLPWYRSGRNLNPYFEFEPYLYGPYSLGVYSALDKLIESREVLPNSTPNERWATFRLTTEGKDRLQAEVTSLDPRIRSELEQAVKEVAGLGLDELLDRVYGEAPEFAVKSIYSRRESSITKSSHAPAAP